MKNSTTLFFAFGLAFLMMANLGCRKEKRLPDWLPGPMTFGTVTAVRNGDNWIASGHGRKIDSRPGYFFIQGGTVDSDTIFRENIAMQPIPLVPGHYPIKRKDNILLLDGFCNASFSLKDDDILEGYYWSDDAYPNYVELIEYDSVNERVRGRFDIHFKYEWPDREDVPRRLHFSEGVFDIRLQL